MIANDSNLIQESIEMLERYAKCLFKGSERIDEEEFNQISSIMMYFCDLKLKTELEENQFLEFLEEIEASGEQLDSDDIIQKFDKKLQKNLKKLKTGEDNMIYQSFKSLLSMGLTRLDDSDITAVSEKMSTLDPITQLPLIDPVKNTKCGHSYEKSSILELIKKKNIKCPIAGCATGSYVKETDLVPDIVLKRYLERIQSS